MLTPALAVLALMLADPPAATTPAAPPPPAPAPATSPEPPKPVDPVVAEINAIMATWKGRNGDPLRGRLGFSIGTRTASDGSVTFWVVSAVAETSCRMDPAGGGLRCDRPPPIDCRLAIAFDQQNLVKAWAVTGPPEVCKGFIPALKGE